MTPLLAQRPRADRAFERLYQGHVHAVYRYALAVLHNEADAEDVTQTTFLSAYRAFSRGERPERPHNWLIKIAHNVCRQRFRDSSRRPQEVAFDEGLSAAAPPADDDVPTATDIRRAIGFLAFNQRAALVMRELEGRSYAEIAQILEVSVGAVETLIFRARRALREQLEGGLTCREAELTLSRLAEERLSKTERGALRAHLRECKECAVLERRSRSQRAALKNLGAVPLPASLGSFFGGGAAGGGAALGTGIGAKIVALAAAGAIAGGIGHIAVKAVAAKDEAAQAALPQLGPQSRYFSPIAAITGGRAAASPLETIFVTSPQFRSSKTAPPEENGATGTATAQPATGPGHHVGVVRNILSPLIPRTPVQLPPVRVPHPPRIQPPQVHLPVEPPKLPPVPPLPLPLPPPPPLP